MPSRQPRAGTPESVRGLSDVTCSLRISRLVPTHRPCVSLSLCPKSERLLVMSSSARPSRSPDRSLPARGGRQLREDSGDGDDTSGCTAAGPSAPARLACKPCRARRVKCDHARPTCAVSVPRAVQLQMPLFSCMSGLHEVGDPL
jgi:hypothetical protein